MFYFDWTVILMLPGLLLGIWAQSKVNNAYRTYSRVSTRSGVTASEAARRMLWQNGAGDVMIEQTGGHLTDHYDPRSNVLRLSSGVCHSGSIAALGIAAHEAGHAIQQAENYPFLKLRTWVAPVVNIGSSLSWPIFFLGLLFSWQPLMMLGILLFAAVVLFTLITLPVEFDASRRALRMLSEGGYLTQQELGGAKQVLSAAALTYVASFVSAALQLLRLLTLARRRD